MTNVRERQESHCLHNNHNAKCSTHADSASAGTHDADKWRRALTMGGVGVSFIVGTPGAPQTNSYTRSYEIFFDVLGVSLEKKRNEFYLGAGFRVRSLYLKDDDLRYERNAQKGLDWVLYPNPAARDKESNFYQWSNYLHLSYTRRLGGKWSVSAHTLFHLNWRGRAASEWTVGAHNYSEEVKNIHIRRFGFDMMAQAAYGNLGLFVKYSPTKVLEDATGGANFRTWGVGLTFGF